jgi:type I restriction enzyme M protein
VARRKAARDNKNNNGANIGYEAQLWKMADALRGGMDAAEYKHVVLGLIFLKYISDAFEEQHVKLEAEKAQGADPEDPDEYRALNIFWVPPEARWSHLKAQAKQPTIGQLVDDAMAGIERDNPSLKGVLPKDYARPGLDKQRLGQLIDLVSNIQVGDEASRSKDVLGRVYEYFLGQFASAEGKKGGEFYTPRSVVRLLVEMLEPYKGRVYDPCCGSSGMFVQSEEFIAAHGGKLGDISIYGQESNYTTWRLAKMNLAIRGIDGQIAHGDTFHNDRHPDLKADFILANPPFNVSDWRGELLRDDKRWKYGVPPAGNANFAWVQHIIHHLPPAGLAGFVLANGSMSSNQSGEGEIRRNIIEADLVDCMIALPGQLFYSTQIPACLWFLARGRKNGKFRDRCGQVLFIDTRKMGRMVDRTHRELTDEQIARIADTYHAWRGEKEAGEYEDVPGFCKSATLEEIRRHGHVLTPGRYVGVEAAEDDGELFEEKMQRLTARLREQQAEAAKLDAAINANLKELGCGA